MLTSNQKFRHSLNFLYILKRNSYYNVNKRLSATRWTTLYLHTGPSLESIRALHAHVVHHLGHGGRRRGFLHGTVRVTSAQRHQRRNLPGRPAPEPAHHKGQGSLAGEAACEICPLTHSATAVARSPGPDQASIIKQSHTHTEQRNENESSSSAN